MPKSFQKLSLFKIGGKVIDNAQALEHFLRGFSQCEGAKILVHGGGIFADQMAQKLGIYTEMHEGRRKTSREMRDLVTMVYGGSINKTLVSQLQALACDAIGLTGADGGIIRAKKRSPNPIDYGYVGDITEVNQQRLIDFLGLGLCPVLAPLSFDSEILNTNADSIAASVASALSPYFDVQMYYAFEAKGVMLDLNDPKSMISELDSSKYQELLAAKVFTEGMLPKLKACFDSIEKGVEAVILADAENCLKASRKESFVGTRLKL